MLLSNESQLIEQAKLAYSPLGKASEKISNKQKKETNEDQGKKQRKITEEDGKQLVESNTFVEEMILILITSKLVIL